MSAFVTSVFPYKRKIPASVPVATSESSVRRLSSSEAILGEVFRVAGDETQGRATNLEVVGNFLQLGEGSRNRDFVTGRRRLRTARAGTTL
jgi:hypothetical protein